MCAQINGVNRDYLVLDLEFTQYTRPVGRPRMFFSEIIEIGAVKIDGSTHEITGHIQQFVTPRFFPKQAAESMVFCMITDADMKTAVRFHDMIAQLAAMYTPGVTYLVSWGDADYNVIAQGCDRHAVANPILRQDCIDLAAAYKKLKGNQHTTGLRKVTEELNIAAEGLWHTAHDDAANTGKILLKLLAGGWKPEDYLAGAG
jgi:sporulation inhibitor KapD